MDNDNKGTSGARGADPTYTPGRPRHWPGLELRGPAAWLDEAEGVVCAALDDDELLGTARLTWRLEGTLPAAAVAALGDDLESLRIYLAPDADAADCAARIEQALQVAWTSWSANQQPPATVVQDVAWTSRSANQQPATVVQDVARISRSANQQPATVVQDVARISRSANPLPLASANTPAPTATADPTAGQPAALPSWSLIPLSTPDDDWATAWRDFFRPVGVSERLAVLPAWWDRADGLRLAGVADAADAVVLRIEPGQAFGSGTHATTRLCLRLMDRILREHRGGRLLDFGAGSGILSFAALALGAESVVAVEIDPDTARNFRDNAELNAEIVAGRPLDHRIGSDDTLGPNDHFETVVCNALFNRVSGSLPGAAAHLAPGGVFIYSGYLLSDRDEVMAFFADRLGLTVREEAGEEEWGALVAGAR